jgi:Fe-S-cluster containining protein
MTNHDNPCLHCPDNCCSISGRCGLMLSKDEFEAHFKDHKQNLSVREENGMVIIAAKEGLMCPHFEKGGCRIYQERPIDCRLHPYQMRPSYEMKKQVKFILHTRSACPRKENLLITEKEAKALVTNFGTEVYGDKKIIVQHCDSMMARLRNKGEALLVKLCRKMGIPL